MTDPTPLAVPERHTFVERVLGRHEWAPVSADRFPLGVTIFSDECWCGARRRRWHEWKDGPLSDADKKVLR